jgi:hypothetical protein
MLHGNYGDWDLTVERSDPRCSEALPHWHCHRASASVGLRRDKLVANSRVPLAASLSLGSLSA